MSTATATTPAPSAELVDDARGWVALAVCADAPVLRELAAAPVHVVVTGATPGRAWVVVGDERLAAAAQVDLAMPLDRGRLAALLEAGRVEVLFIDPADLAVVPQTRTIPVAERGRARAAIARALAREWGPARAA